MKITKEWIKKQINLLNKRSTKKYDYNQYEQGYCLIDEKGRELGHYTTKKEFYNSLYMLNNYLSTEK